jgi:microcystin-dependent protein
MLMRKLSLLAVSLLLFANTAGASPVLVLPGDQGGNTHLITSAGPVEAQNLFTVGAVNIFMTTPLPEGWLECNGSTITSADYPDLVKYLGGPAATSVPLPDYRGEFLRGWDNSRGVDVGRSLGSVQSEEMFWHTHSGTAVNSDPAVLHSHTGTTSPAGAHTHIIPKVTPPNYSGSYLGSGGGYGRKYTSAYTNAAGAHSHTGSLSPGGAHTHDADILPGSDGGGPEFRPKNIAVIFAIRATK